MICDVGELSELVTEVTLISLDVRLDSADLAGPSQVAKRCKENLRSSEKLSLWRKIGAN